MITRASAFIYLAINELGSAGTLLSKTVTDCLYDFKSISNDGNPACSRIDFDTSTLMMIKLIGMMFCRKNKIQLRTEFKYFFLNIAIHWLSIRPGPLIKSVL